MTDHEFDTPQPLALHVQIGRGRVDLTAADTTRSLVEVTGPGAEEVEVHLSGDQLNVIQPSRSGFLRDRQVTVRITVPSGSAPAVRTGSADVHLSGVVGDTEIRTGSGDVRIEVVDGPALVETGSGDVAIDEAHGPLRLKSGSGDLVVGHAAAPVAASTGSGDVRIDTSDGPVVTKTGSGDMLIRHAASDIGWQTGTGDLAVQRVERGQVSAKSASGDIVLGVPPRLPVWTDMHSTTGDVSSDLEGVGEPAPGADHLEVRATTATGDIRLRRAD